MVKAWNIGSLSLDSPVVAAPMAGVTDSAYRLILRRYGASAVYTEMVSAKGLHYKSENTAFLLQHEKEESPIFVQLFGSEPAILLEAALKLEEEFDGIDLNMGCPAPKIFHNHEGSYLLKEPKLAYEIVHTLKRHVKKPVTVKIRKGIEDGEELAPDFAKGLEEAGADAICIHGRTTSQGYSGRADWGTIARVKQKVKIPVIGNGDIASPQDALSMIRHTGCDAVMIGRAGHGNPWLFAKARALLLGEEAPQDPSPLEVGEMCLYHARAVCQDKGEYLGMRQMRTHVMSYLKGFRGSASLRSRVVRLAALEELRELLQEAGLLEAGSLDKPC